MAMHDGHRTRVKQRFLTEGLANFDELHALELQYQRALINASSADYSVENRDISQAREALEKENSEDDTTGE